MPIPPALIVARASSVPLPSRTRALNTPSNPVPTPQTDTGSSTMSYGQGWRIEIGGNPGMAFLLLRHNTATTMQTLCVTKDAATWFSQSVFPGSRTQNNDAPQAAGASVGLRRGFG